MPPKCRRWGYLPASALDPAIPSDPILWDAERWEQDMQKAREVLTWMRSALWDRWRIPV
jgi:hypothetical protein